MGVCLVCAGFIRVCLHWIVMSGKSRDCSQHKSRTGPFRSHSVFVCIILWYLGGGGGGGGVACIYILLVCVGFCLHQGRARPGQKAMHITVFHGLKSRDSRKYVLCSILSSTVTYQSSCRSFVLKKMTKSRFCRFPYWTLMGRWSDAGIYGWKTTPETQWAIQKALESKRLKVRRR